VIKLGLDGKLYRNNGTYDVPDWVELTNVKDVTLNLEKGEADVTVRANQGWRATAATLKEGSVEFEMAWDTDDAGFTAITVMPSLRSLLTTHCPGSALASSTPQIAIRFLPRNSWTSRS